MVPTCRSAEDCPYSANALSISNFVGPGLWAPPAEPPEWLARVDRPIALITCSTEHQHDRAIVETAVNALPDEGLFVVATSAAHEVDGLPADLGTGGRLERFVPHGPVVERAEVVVCHGGMGITQRALAHGVPVVVVPFGRDQLEVGRRVEHAGAGVRLSPKDLNPAALADAVRRARTMREGAGRIAAASAASGGAGFAADCTEELLGQRHRLGA